MISRVLAIVAEETPGDHWLSHYVMAHKVLRESCASSIRIADAFKHRALTQEDCDGLLSDWLDEGWLS